MNKKQCFLFLQELIRNIQDILYSEELILITYFNVSNNFERGLLCVE